MIYCIVIDLDIRSKIVFGEVDKIIDLFLSHDFIAGMHGKLCQANIDCDEGDFAVADVS